MTILVPFDAYLSERSLNQNQVLYNSTLSIANWQIPSFERIYYMMSVLKAEFESWDQFHSVKSVLILSSRRCIKCFKKSWVVHIYIGIAKWNKIVP